MADDNQNQVLSQTNFWEVDGYKKTVKRTDDGLVLCNELMKLMQERADIEKKYAEKIKSWGKKWNEIFDKSPAYGSTRDVLKGSLKEADKLSESHIIIKDRLLNIVSANVMDWKAENYKKQLIGCKPAKTFEEEFQRAQKPWAKKLEKVNKAKKDYYAVCRQHRALAVQETLNRQRTDQSADQIKKFQEKVEKYHREVELSREKYNRAVEELNALNGKYMEDMSLVFAKTQDFDKKRIDFFRDILHKFAETLDLSRNQIISETYQQFHRTVDDLNPDSDLKWWSQNHGIDVAMSWPQFEEFADDSPPDRGSRLIGDNGAVAAVIAAGVVSGQSQDLNRQSTWDQSPDPTVGGQSLVDGANTGPVQNWYSPEPSNGQTNAYDDAALEDLEAASSVAVMSAASSSSSSSNAFSGVKVRALYDYDGQEEDELSFKIDRSRGRRAVVFVESEGGEMATTTARAVEGQQTMAAAAAEDGPPGGDGAAAAASLLIVIGELQSADERDLALQRVVDGLLSFDCEKSGCNLEDELNALVTHLTKDGADAGDGVLEWKSEHLHVVILVSPRFDVFQKNLRSFLLTSSCYRFLLYSGLMLQNSGCWFLRDAYLDLSSISEVFHRPDVCQALSTQLGSKLDICVMSEVSEWMPDNVSKLSSHLTVRLNPPKLTEKSDSISSLSSFLSAFLTTPSSADLLVSTTEFGNFSQASPTLHVFPGGQGDSALFSVNGVNLLFDVGYGRQSCFWDLVRHLRCLDAIILSHFGPDNLFGLESFLEKKVLTSGFPEIGTIFLNTSKIKSVQTADRTASLLVNLADRAARVFDSLHRLSTVVLPCLGSIHNQTLLPIPLYHKVGHGSVDLYVLNPLADNKEAKELMSNWTKSLGSHKARVPVLDHVSLCSLLVWKSVSASENPVRILFSGNAPQAKIFEGLDRLKTVGIFQSTSGIVEKSANGAKLAAAGGKTAPVGKVGPHTAAKLEKKDTAKAANEQKAISEKTKTEKKVADHQREPKKIAGEIKDEKRMQTEKKNEKIPSTATKKNVPAKGGQSATKIIKKQEGDNEMKKETETPSVSDAEVNKIEASNEKGMKNIVDADVSLVEAEPKEPSAVSSAAVKEEDNLSQSQALPTADLETEELKVEKGMLEEREDVGMDKGSPNALDSKCVKPSPESLTNVGFNPEREWGIPEGLPAPVNGKEPTAARKVGQNTTASATAAASNDIKKVGDASGTVEASSLAAKRPATAPERQNNTVRNGTKNTVKAATGQSIAGGSSARGDPKKPPAKPLVPFYVDVAYIPAHGSPSHFDVNFFCRVRARHYVLSSISPILKALALLVEAKQTWDDPSSEVTVIPTYSSDSLIAWISENQDQLQKLNIKVAPPASKCTVQLLDTACASYRIEF